MENLIFIAALIILIVVHELVHGLSWSIFTEHGFKDIEFGIMQDSMTPYCTCKVPLTKRNYLIGCLMPLVAVGILPTVIALFTGSFLLLLLGLIMIVSAAGDILIAWKILQYKSSAEEILYYDHPTEAGGVIFER